MIRSLAILLLASLPFTSAQTADSKLQATLAGLANEIAGMAGISVLHVESGAGASVYGGRRFPMMSVYKLPIAIHALREADAGRLSLDERVTLGKEDRRPGASALAETIAAKGPQTLTIAEVLTAVVTQSDNTASDWLLRRVGGPSKVAATLRALKIAGIDVSRYELEFAADYYGFCCTADIKPFSLEQFGAAVQKIPPAMRLRAARIFETDPRDATTPSGYITLLARLQRGELLSARSTSWLLDTMQKMHARDGRIRAGLPPGTAAALRPGTSATTSGVRAAHNDTGIVTLPGDRGHLAIAIFLRGTRGTDESRDAAIARIARAAYEWAMAR